MSASEHPFLAQVSFKRLVQKLFVPAFDRIQMNDRQTAHLICRLIPANCPFERDIFFLGRKIAHIPAMCKLNPLYDQFVELRFRALSFLADECGEDITPYCH
ncbi:Mo-dependent nitrogenase C-terminal domain-containing protein [Altericista sp. CCNU0014]|uniref:Mo-dependent nitrogenase C-terminal domain-containing protein n=1 Tax=Altericista sp. CCNU0014 TaxID=3082949 RepID=UPI003850FDCB